MPAKSFDCVAMNRKGARCVYALTKGMTIKEEVAFWRKKTAQLRRRQRRRRLQKAQ